MLSKNEELLSDLSQKDTNNSEMENLFIFWNDKIMKNITQFKDFKNLNILINEIGQKIKKLETKKEEKEQKEKNEEKEEKKEKNEKEEKEEKENKLKQEEFELGKKNELETKGENNILSLRSSMPLNSYKRSSLVEKVFENSPKKILDSEDEEEDNEI